MMKLKMKNPASRPTFALVSRSHLYLFYLRYFFIFFSSKPNWTRGLIPSWKSQVNMELSPITLFDLEQMVRDQANKKQRSEKLCKEGLGCTSHATLDCFYYDRCGVSFCEDHHGYVRFADDFGSPPTKICYACVRLNQKHEKRSWRIVYMLMALLCSTTVKKWLAF